jgi:hypothetical protein
MALDLLYFLIFGLKDLVQLRELLLVRFLLVCVHAHGLVESAIDFLIHLDEIAAPDLLHELLILSPEVFDFIFKLLSVVLQLKNFIGLFANLGP